MKFARIEMLFLIWIAPLLFLVFLYGMKKRKRILSRFSSSRGLKAIVPDADRNRRWLKAGLLLCTLLFTALALSGPQYGYKWQEIERKGIDIIIALDCSRSMLATDIKPTRLDRAKREVYDLLTMLRGDRAGLVAFAGTAFLQCPLTLDYDAFNLFLKSLSPDFLPIGGTDITAAVQISAAGFDEKANSEKAVILITDGENTGQGDPVKAAEAAKEAGIKLFCIGVGNEDGVPIRDKQGGLKKDKSGNIILTKLDEETLKRMAVLTGGTYVRSVAGDMDLEAIYMNEIRGKMEAQTLESGRKQIWEDRYQWFLAVAILAMIAELFLSSAKKTGAVLGLLLLLTYPYSVYAGPAQEGLEAYRNGAYDQALKLFIDAQLEDPDNPRILYNIGNAYYKTGDFDAAISNFKAVLKSKDKYLRKKAFFNLGNANFRKGNYEEAIKNYEEALNIDTDDLYARENYEFTKKIMEQMKEQQQQSGDNDSEESDDKKEDDSEQQKGDSEEQKSDSEEKEQSENTGENKESSQEDESGKEENSPKYGDEMKQQEAPEQKAGSQKQEDEQKTGMAQAEPPEEPDEEGEEKKQAERVLNRLKDQPGKAMIPAYRKRSVEKDW